MSDEEISYLAAMQAARSVAAHMVYSRPTRQVISTFGCVYELREAKATKFEQVIQDRRIASIRRAALDKKRFKTSRS